MLVKVYSVSNYWGSKSLSNAILNWLVTWGILVVRTMFAFGLHYDLAHVEMMLK